MLKDIDLINEVNAKTNEIKGSSKNSDETNKKSKNITLDEWIYPNKSSKNSDKTIKKSNNTSLDSHDSVNNDSKKSNKTIKKSNNDIDYEQFKELVIKVLNRDIESNLNQDKAIHSKRDESLFIVAGPGSGKTTVIVLKILKFIFVDGISPDEIIATTFTNKSAKELYSRILEWGTRLKTAILEDFNIKDNSYLKRLDFSQLITGTIDSIADDLLKIYKEPGTDSPLIIENFVSISTMTRVGLFNNNRYLNEDLMEYLGKFVGKDKISNPSKMSEILLNIKNRMFYDHVDIELLKREVDDIGVMHALDAIEDYEKHLSENVMFDFPMLESFFLDKLNNNKLDDFLENIKIILVDEYQDTNLIQEMIYFKIAESAIKNKGNITVVGDDDQSVYRFRGATVNLFTQFKDRIKEQLGIDVKEVNLSTNYRSTEDIINLCNHFVELDEEYQNVRVAGKPRIEDAKLKEESIPILGMFRSDAEILANDLSRLINNLLKNKQVKYKVNKNIFNEKPEKEYPKEIFIQLGGDGSMEDIAILTYSPKEYSFGNPLFPYYLRKFLKRKEIEVFNPRGQDLQDVKPVAILCGLILECIDPNSKVQKRIKTLPKRANTVMKKWRRYANEFIESSPEPKLPISLETYVHHWKERIIYDENNHSSDKQWPESISLIDLTYKLIRWFNYFQEDSEGLVYLEAIAKTINQTGFLNEFSAKIYFTKTDTREFKSIEEAIWNIFVPIATGGVLIDENLLESLPENRINIMSIHQSKGLEFPFVIVDVGSRFKKNQVRTSFLRFPKEKGENSTFLEDEIKNYSPLGKENRSRKNREFDDLTRLYFVAFSRAQDVLLLVGLDSALAGYMDEDDNKKIPNVALGWKRDKEFVGLEEIILI
jgi:DNA helicase-2/ATP-dependent DNA helicase PcrA